MAWTEEQKARILELWAANHSQVEIAMIMECSRGAVAGVLHRNGAIKKGYTGPRVKMRKEAVTVEDPPRDVPAPDGARYVPWIDLQRGECQWALNGFWDGPSHEMPCCGLHTEGRNKFCNYHETWARVKG